MNTPNSVEHEKSIDFNGVKLQGSLCLPATGKAAKVVLMVTGSGEVDRNENAMQMQLNTFNSLSISLAEAGIASLRFDKRGCASSGGRYHESGFHDFVEDANEWLAALGQFEGVEAADRYVLGHAEGALIAAFLSTRNPDMKGQILLTPFLENVEQGIERQLQHTLDEVSVLTGIKGFMVRLILRLSGNQLKRQRKIMKRIKSTNKSSIKIKKTLINAKWLREVTAIDPADIYQQVKHPTLIIGGEKDLQCIPEDTNRIAALIDTTVESHTLSNLTHILRADEDTPSTFSYKKLAEDPIDARVPELIVHWLARF